MAMPPPKKPGLPPGVGFLMKKSDRGDGADAGGDPDGDEAAEEPDAAAAVDGDGDQGAETPGVDPQLEDALRKLLAAYGPKELQDALQHCIEQYGTKPDDDADGNEDVAPQSAARGARPAAGGDDGGDGDHEYR